MFFDKGQTVVFVGAHTDDEMGCAGTLGKCGSIRIQLWVTLSVPPCFGLASRSALGMPPVEFSGGSGNFDRSTTSKLAFTTSS